MIHEEENVKIDFSWFLFIGHCKLGFTEKEVFRMTLKKFNQLYNHYKIYHDLDMKQITFEELEEAQAKDDEWF